MITLLLEHMECYLAGSAPFFVKPRAFSKGSEHVFYFDAIFVALHWVDSLMDHPAPSRPDKVSVKLECSEVTKGSGLGAGMIFTAA